MLEMQKRSPVICKNYKNIWSEQKMKKNILGLAVSSLFHFANTYKFVNKRIYLQMKSSTNKINDQIPCIMSVLKGVITFYSGKTY